MLRITETASAGTGGWRRDFPRFSPEQLFALVSDIERYPEFVPCCLKARVVERGPTVWKVENVFGFGPVRRRFMSHAELEPPHRLDITSREDPWRDFRMLWRFQEFGTGCRLYCALSMVFRSPFLAGLAQFASGELERTIVTAFERRAEAVYGTGRPDAPSKPPFRRSRTYIRDIRRMGRRPRYTVGPS